MFFNRLMCEFVNKKRRPIFEKLAIAAFKPAHSFGCHIDNKSCVPIATAKRPALIIGEVHDNIAVDQDLGHVFCKPFKTTELFSDAIFCQHDERTSICGKRLGRRRHSSRW